LKRTEKKEEENLGFGRTSKIRTIRSFSFLSRGSVKRNGSNCFFFHPFTFCPPFEGNEELVGFPDSRQLPWIGNGQVGVRVGSPVGFVLLLFSSRRRKHVRQTRTLWL